MKSRRNWITTLLVSLCCGATCWANDDAPLLRVLTYNIHHGEGTDGRFDYRRLANVISSLRPDVVTLQEVDRNTKRSRQLDQAAHLAELTNMQFAFGRAMHFSGGEYGEAILSKYPIEQTWTHPLPYRLGQEPRAALAAQIKPTGALPGFVLVGAHLCHQSEDTRVEQAGQLNQLFPASGGPPILLTGDLNARPGSRPIKVLFERGWVDATAPQSRIDYVLTRDSDPWKVREVIVVPDDVTSDHRPVLAVLEWAPRE